MDVDDLFFALHLILSGKQDMCGRDYLFYLALLVSAALGFKIFANAALRAKVCPLLAYATNTKIQSTCSTKMTA